jgi:nucleoside-diphosphate-sugar epimerase
MIILHNRSFETDCCDCCKMIHPLVLVVFGAAGALGAAIVQNLAQQNKPVRAVVRDADRAPKVLPSSTETVAADTSKHDVSVIYHCVNVP